MGLVSDMKLLTTMYMQLATCTSTFHCRHMTIFWNLIGKQWIMHEANKCSCLATSLFLFSLLAIAWGGHTHTHTHTTGLCIQWDYNREELPTRYFTNLLQMGPHVTDSVSQSVTMCIIMHSLVVMISLWDIRSSRFFGLYFSTLKCNVRSYKYHQKRAWSSNTSTTHHGKLGVGLLSLSSISRAKGTCLSAERHEVVNTLVTSWSLSADVMLAKLASSAKNLRSLIFTP